MKRFLAVAALLSVFAAVSSANAATIGTGWDVIVKYGAPSSGPNSIAESQAFFSSNTASSVSGEIAPHINYMGYNGDGDIGGGIQPPGYPNEPNTDHYVINAYGIVTGVVGTQSVTVTVNSDDGFGFYDNGVLVGAYDNNRGPAPTSFTFNVTNGDHVNLLYWENGGGDEVEVYSNSGAGNVLLNDVGSVFGVNQVPEPSSVVALVGMAAAGLGMLVYRRKQRAAA